MDLHGVTGKPYAHPKVQKTLPAPFQRPSINAGGTPVKRSWQQTKVADLTEGDIVADFGLVEQVQLFVSRDPHEYYVDVTNVLAVTKRFGIHETVLAFHPAAR